jgi:hypothetical protein
VPGSFRGVPGETFRALKTVIGNAGLPAKTPGWRSTGYPPGAAPDLAPQVRGIRPRLILCGSWEFLSMEFWRTDEIAPVVLILLLELMLLGLINYTMPI